MVPKKKKISRCILLWACIGAVGVLAVQRAMAVATAADDVISHLCFGEMDFDFRAPERQRSIWTGEYDRLKMKGCTYKKYGFESAFPGRRFVVAGTSDRQTAVMAYIYEGSPANHLAATVAALKKYGFFEVGQIDVDNNGEKFALLNSARAQLQVVAVPYLHEQNMLLVVRTPAIFRKEKQQ